MTVAVAVDKQEEEEVPFFSRCYLSMLPPQYQIKQKGYDDDDATTRDALL